MHARNEDFLHASRVTRPRIWTGLVLNESYRIGSLVEQGAAAEIYDGTEVSTGEPVALKILLPQLAQDEKTRALFLDEARALRRLSQPGLLRYRSCARDPQSDLTYIVTDVVGMRLSSRLANRKLGEEDVVALTKRLALALAAAHGAGVIHRGLRPHAIALPQGRLSDATITDFNLIKSAHTGHSAAFDDAMVDHDFCAPEQLSKSGEGAVIGPWTDVYSLALVILSALGGKQSDAQRKASPDLSLLPARLRPVFEHMLEPKPSRRLQSMDEVVKQIDGAPGSGRGLLNRVQSVSLPRLRRAIARETQAVVRGVERPPPAPAKPAPAIAAPVRAPLPPLPSSLRPAMPVPLGKFHEARASVGRGGIARRAAVGLSALLLAASPWIIQTSLPSGPADASTVAPPAKVQTASVATPAPPVVAPLPAGRVYGADNTNSRITLRFHRPTRVSVHSRGERLLFSRGVQAGDSYRAPSLSNLTVTADDAGAVEVLFSGTSAGFVGSDGQAVEKAPLAQLASLAPRPPAPPVQTAAVPEASAPALTPEQADAVRRGLAALEEDLRQEETAQAEPLQPSAPVEQEVASVQAPEPPAPAPPIQLVPEPPLPSVQVTPVVAYVPLPEQLVLPPAPEPARRPLLGRLMPRLFGGAAEPDADAVILAPAISKEAVDRQKAAADQAKAANDAAREKARADTRAREGAFRNSTLGINSQY
jgi:serine/threonine protein kinase